MKYAAVVLFHNRTPLSSVDYGRVTDALLGGGVFLDEVVALPYDAPSALSAALLRLSLDCDGVFVVCDRALLARARDAASEIAEAEFTEEYLLETEKCLFAVLPAGERGAELVRTETIPRVDARRRVSYSRVVLRTVSAPADKLRAAIGAAESAAGGMLEIHASESYGCARIELIYDGKTPKMAADEAVRILATELCDYLYALEDVGIAEQLVSALRLRRMRVSTAESFTGGGVGRAIVRVPGASTVFFEGLNTYDPKAKEVRLGVSPNTIRLKGVVSDQTAYEMAAGLLAAGNCDLAIATTGYAGPSTDLNGTPAGLCYLAVGTREQVRVFRYRFSGDRETVTETAINVALFLAYREIK